jgi:dTDP-4-dehydrorhamnose reductase
MELMEKRVTGIYHLADAIRISRYEFAELIAETLIKPISLDKIRWIAKKT